MLIFPHFGSVRAKTCFQRTSCSGAEIWLRSSGNGFRIEREDKRKQRVKISIRLHGENYSAEVERIFLNKTAVM